MTPALPHLYRPLAPQADMVYKNLKQPCHCFMCMGRLRQARTVKRHAQFERFRDTIIDDSNVFPAQLPAPADHGDLTDADGNIIRGLRRISEDTRNLLDAYDQYFTSQDDLDTTLWVSQHKHIHARDQVCCFNTWSTTRTRH